MCCLKYEQDAYEDLIRTSPKLESFVDTPDGRGTVIELDLLRQRVKVRFEERAEATGTFANSEIAVLRNGKAKKNDPPIPADLAPISGAGKRRKLDLDAPMQLDAIKFRYSTEAIAEEQEVGQAPAEEVSAQQENRKASHRRRNRRGKSAGERSAEQSQKEHKAEKKPEEKAEGAEDAARRRRRNHHRRRRPQSGAEG